MATSTTDIATPSPTTMASLPCCPEMTRDETCDILDFHYRLNRQVTLAQTGAQGLIPVEIKLHFRLTRCPGPFVLGNLLYTNTLFPGEKVKLFTSDRRTKFTFDSTTQLSYRNTQTTEESFFMHQMSDMLFDTSSRDSGNSSNQSHAHVDGHGDAGIDIIGMGGSANMSGNFDANSLSTFLNEHSSHAQSSANAAEMGASTQSVAAPPSCSKASKTSKDDGAAAYPRHQRDPLRGLADDRGSTRERDRHQRQGRPLSRCHQPLLAAPPSQQQLRGLVASAAFSSALLPRPHYAAV